eukprot:Hpha_TRINITY_DN16166_c9_g1::TRINITY_DN16166_c9_g1_i1::g.4411::m.4411
MKYPPLYLGCAFLRLLTALGPFTLLICHTSSCYMRSEFTALPLIMTATLINALFSILQCAAQVHTFTNRDKVMLGQAVPLWRSVVFAGSLCSVHVLYGAVTSAFHIWPGFLMYVVFQASTLGSTLAAIGQLSKKTRTTQALRALGAFDLMLNYAVASGNHKDPIGYEYFAVCLVHALMYFTMASTTVLRSSMVRVSFHIAKVVVVDLFLVLLESRLLLSASTELQVLIVLGIVTHACEGGAAVRSAVELGLLLEEVRELQERRERSGIGVALEIAAALVRYDVDGAERAIDSTEAGDLPDELVRTYQLLLLNLRSYKDYLPEAIFNDERDKESRPSVMPPALGQEGWEVEVGMVFTDIQSSTALWEAHPNEMYDALRTHNAALRDVAAEHHGYEVKIIGDALMLAFAKASDAVHFGAEAQLRLVLSEWPPALCESGLCCRVDGVDGVPLWYGMRVRIGINWGAVQAELNPVNNRYDYFGATVNTASRVEAALKHGGLTGVTQAVLDEMGEAVGEGLFIAPMGEKELKGVAKPVAIHVVLPVQLADRWKQKLFLNVPTSTKPPALTVGAGIRVVDAESPKLECLSSPSHTGLSPSPFSSPHGGRKKPTSPDLTGGASAAAFLTPLKPRNMTTHNSWEIHTHPRQTSHRSSGGVDTIMSIQRGIGRSSFTSSTEDTSSTARRRSCGSNLMVDDILSRCVSNPHLTLGLTPSQATCVAVRARLAEGGWSAVGPGLSQMLVAVEQAALRTEGQMVGVVSSVCLLAWNAATRCVDAVSQGVHFTTLLRVPCSAGMATGRALTGNISGSRRRHVVVAGACADLSISLSEKAALRRMPLLAAGSAGAYLATRGQASKVGVWEEGGGEGIEVWAVQRGDRHG